MAYATTVALVEGDNLPGIQFKIRDRNNAPPGQFFDKKDPTTWAEVDLRNATVTIKIRPLGEPTISDEQTLTILEPLSGQVLLSLASTTFQDIPGTYEAEVTVNYDGSGQQTVYDFIRFEVRERF